MEVLAPLLPNRLVVITAPDAARTRMLQLAAGLALRGPLRVLDGNNCFNAFRVARMLRSHTVHLNEALENIRLARGFTCYQVMALLERCDPLPEPTLAFELLATFYDENVPFPEVRRLTERAAVRLVELARSAPVVVSLRPPPEMVQGRGVLVEMLLEAASEVWPLEAEDAPALPGNSQLSLPFG